MILAAGLGTRLRPLSSLRPKPILPVRGIPLLAYPLAWLAHHGVDEVIVNLHHFPDATRAVAEVWAPPGLRVHFSEEPVLLDTGGGIRRAANFLRESDPSLVIAGDMILDLDLQPLLARHRERGDAATLVLREDPRAARFGTIGIDAASRLRRIARRFDLGGETRVLSPESLELGPERLDLPALLDEVQHPAVSEHRPHDEGDDRDGGPEDPGLHPGSGLTPGRLVTRRQGLILYFNDRT